VRRHHLDHVVGHIEQRRIAVFRRVVIFGKRDPPENVAVDVPQAITLGRSVDRMQVTARMQRIGFSHTDITPLAKSCRTKGRMSRA